MDDLPIEIPNDPSEKSQPARRGWWDYVPEEEQSRGDLTVAEETKKRPEGTFRSLLQRIPRFMDRQKLIFYQVKNSKLQRKANSEKRPKNSQGSGNPERSRLSLAPSSMSRISRLVPRMELFQEVMKDEASHSNRYVASAELSMSSSCSIPPSLHQHV